MTDAPTEIKQPAKAPVLARHTVEWHPIVGTQALERVRLAAAWDGHGQMLMPTHVLLRGEEIVGCTSLGAIALTHTWLHTEKCRKFDCLRALRDVGVIARNIGFKGVVAIADAESQLFPHMPSMEFKDLGQANLWLKMLTKQTES